MLKLLGLTGCLCSKAHSKVVHPTPKAESIFHCKECSRTLPTQEQYDNHMCQYHLKSESNTTTPKAGSFDEHHYFEWRREGKEESVVLDRYFIGRMQGDRSPTVTKSVIMEQSSTSSMNLSPTRIDNSPDRFSSKSFLGNEKSEQLIGDPNIIKIVNSIKEQSARTRIKMEAKFIKTYSSKKSSKKFLISESWMEYYGKYLNGEKTEPPGPIDNKELKKRLLLKKTSSGSLYAANESIWFFLRAMYGGGPELCHMNEIPVHKLPKLERMKTDGNDDLGSPIKIRSKPKSLTYSQKPLLADLNYCLRPIKMLKNESSSSVIACFQFLLGVSDLLKCMEQERSINVANLRTSRFVRGFQDVIDAHLKDNKFFLAANLKKIFQDQISDAQYLDAHNFLNIYLNGFMSEFSPNPALSEARSAELKTNTSYLSQTFLSIKSLFGGVVLSTVKCLNCGKKTQTYNECLSLSLPIIHKTTKTIDDCLNLFQKETQDESLHYCERCKSESRTMKQSLVSTFPKYLIVHLDRFEEGTNKKKEDLVNYLAENWKVKGSSEKETSNYSLAGVITHNGPLDSGHYTCLTKRGEEWYMCDDEEVKKVQSKKSIVKDAYILLYQRMN